MYKARKKYKLFQRLVCIHRCTLKHLAQHDTEVHYPAIHIMYNPCQIPLNFHITFTRASKSLSACPLTREKNRE